MIEIYCTVSIAPIPIATMSNPRMGQHRHELPQRAVRAGIPRLPHHGVRCDLCRAHQQHDHRSQYPLGAILGGSLYGHSLLLPVQDRFACKVTIQCPLRKEGQLEEILRDLRRPSVAYKVYSKKGLGRSAESHYPTMSLEDIKALPIGELAAKDCALFMWITFPCMQEAFQVLEAWGFEYKTTAFVWIKQNRVSDSLFWGMGYWTRANAELCILATKGHPKRAAPVCIRSS